MFASNRAPTRRRQRNSHSVVGIDIGSSCAKILQFEGQSNPRVRFARTVAHQRSLIGLNADECLDEIDRTIGRLWSRRNAWLPHPAACTLSMMLTPFHSVELSPESAADPNALATAFLTEQATDGGQDWSIAGWPLLNDGPESATARYGAIGVSERFANSLASLLWSRGLDCQRLDAVPFALARVASSDSHSPIAVLDWGFSGSTLVLSTGQQPIFVRRLQGCGLAEIFQSLDKHFDGEADEYRQLLSLAGDAELTSAGLQEVLTDLLAPSIAHLHEELELTCSYLAQRSNLPRVEDVAVVGGGAALPFCLNLLRRYSDRRIFTWECPGEWRLEDRTIDCRALYASAGSLSRMVRIR